MYGSNVRERLGYASWRNLLLYLWLFSLGSNLNPPATVVIHHEGWGWPIDSFFILPSLRHWTDEDDLRASCAPRWSISKNGEFYDKKNSVELWRVSLLGRVAIGSSSLAIISYTRDMFMYCWALSIRSRPRKTETLRGDNCCKCSGHR